MTRLDDAVKTAPVEVDPRIQQRRDDVARRRVRRRLQVAAGVGGTLVIMGGVWSVLHSPILAARHVTVVGAVHTGVAPVVAAAGLAAEPPLVDIDPAKVAARVEALPWVAHATVTRHWPDDVRVTITERVPVAAVMRPGQGAVLVDGSGRVLASLPDAPAGTIVLSEPVAPGKPGTDLVRAARPALTVLARLPDTLRPRVEHVDVASNGVVTLVIGHDLYATLGPAVDLPAKFIALASVLADAPPTPPAVIDVTVPGSPAVGPPPS